MTRRLTLLLAALLAALTLAPSAASADAQNRVGAFLSAALTHTPANPAENPCTHPGSIAGSARTAVGFCVAIKAGRGADDVPASTPVGRSGMKGELNVTKPNAPAEIGGRQYSGHALDRMQGRGFTPSVVEDAIAHGRTAGGRTGSAIHYSPSNHLSVVVGRNGRVVTVSRGDLRPR